MVRIYKLDVPYDYSKKTLILEIPLYMEDMSDIVFSFDGKMAARKVMT